MSDLPQPVVLYTFWGDGSVSEQVLGSTARALEIGEATLKKSEQDPSYFRDKVTGYVVCPTMPPIAGRTRKKVAPLPKSRCKTCRPQTGRPAKTECKSCGFLVHMTDTGHCPWCSGVCERCGRPNAECDNTCSLTALKPPTERKPFLLSDVGRR